MSGVLELLGASAGAEARRGMRAGEQLRAQVLRLADGAGALRVHNERVWSSATFNGTRHTLQLRFEGAYEISCGERLIESVAAYPAVVPGHLVAEIKVVDVDHRALDEMLTVTIEALLIEEH